MVNRNQTVRPASIASSTAAPLPAGAAEQHVALTEKDVRSETVVNQPRFREPQVASRAPLCAALSSLSIKPLIVRVTDFVLQ